MKRMNAIERIYAMINNEPVDRTGFWLGNPHADSWPIYYEFFGTTDQQAIRRQLGDDVAWVHPNKYNNPYGLGPFQVAAKKAHGTAGPMGSVTDVPQVDEHPWPDPDLMDFGPAIQELRETSDRYRLSGMWSCFYHDVMDLFGMENYMMNMYLHPDIVHAVTDHVCDFYYQANERFYAEAGDLMDGFFFGNDFGTQLDLICGPAQFDAFILPWMKQFTDQAKRHGKHVWLHSCGSIYKVIDKLIDIGVDCLHPLQAKAANMDAETLAHDFGGRIVFVGGIDTQDLLVNGMPQQVADDVHRVKRLLGPRLVVSPSHEALLPNVLPENIVAMAQAATEER